MKYFFIFSSLLKEVVKIRGKDISIAFVFAVLLAAMLMHGGNVNVNAQSSIAWHTSYQEGMQIAGSQDKPTMIFFESGGCPNCKKQKVVFAYARLINTSKNFVPITGSKWLEGQYGIRYIPAIVFTNSQGEEVYRLVGYYDADTLIEEMQYAIRLSSNPVQPPFQDPYAHDTKTPGFGEGVIKK